MRSRQSACLSYQCSTLQATKFMFAHVFPEIHVKSDHMWIKIIMTFRSTSQFGFKFYTNHKPNKILFVLCVDV